MSPPTAAARLISYLLLSIEAFLTTYTLGKFRTNADACIFWRPVVDIFGQE